MAITQDTTITVGTGATAKTFGVSKTLDHYTLDELKTVGEWAYSAYNDNVYNANIFREVWYNNVLINLTNTESAIMLSTMPDNKLFTEGFNLQSKGVFFRNVLVYNEYYDEVDWSHEYIGIGNPNLSRYRIVTDIDLQDLKISINDTDINKYNPTYTTCKLGVNDVMICPIQLIILDDNTVLFNMALPFNGGRGTAGRNYSWLTYKLWGYDDPVIKNYGMASSSEDMLLRNITGANNPAYYLAPNGIDYELQDGFQNKTFTSADSLVSCDSYEWGGFRFFRFQLNQSNLDAPYLWHAFAGVRFEVDGVTYKPIVSGGMITGYTSDNTVHSEFDDWQTIKDHNVPSTRPSGGSGEVDDELTEMPIGYIGGTAGMVNFIKINSAGLASADDISAAISRFDITTIGKDLLRNLISYKCFALLSIDDSVQRQIKIAGHGLKDENDNDLEGVYIGAVAPVDFGDIKIPKLYEDFRDYAPYTRIEMYIPFCGWFDLPSWCMGRTVNGTIFTDLYNGTVKALVYADNTVVAEVGGCCAYDIPFVADATGMKAGAVISSALTTAAATGATIATPNVATGIAAVTSAANTISAANANPTSLKGVMGDGSNLNGLLHIYVKITRPQSPTGTKSIPATYKHEFGVPCFKELTLATGDGFTQINDATITGAMTDREKQMIIDGFRHGLIL